MSSNGLQRWERASNQQRCREATVALDHTCYMRTLDDVRPLSLRGAVGTAALVAVAGWGHVGYPLWLLWRTRGRDDPEAPRPRGWPSLTVVVPAYREAGVIDQKVQDLKDNNYPGEIQIVVVADDQETAEAGRRTGAEVISSPQRLGKAEALNMGFKGARQPIVVITDANTVLSRDALKTLVRWMDDPSVTAVAGEKRVGDTRGGQAWFWTFESWIKRRESLTGTTIGLVGELAAIRRNCFRPLPSDLAVDDLWLALDVLEYGGRIVYEPNAVAFEEPSFSTADEWERRTRVVAGVLDVLWKRRRLLRPGVPFATQLWGHRLVRSSIGPIAHLLLLVITTTRWNRSRLAVAFLGLHVPAVVTLARLWSGRPTYGPERLLSQVLFLQLVGLGGTLRFLRRDRLALWPKLAR